MDRISTKQNVNGCYRVYGLRIQIDGLLPGLMPALVGPVDVCFDLLGTQPFMSLPVPPEVRRTIVQNTYSLFYSHPDFNVWAVQTSDGLFYRINLLDEGKDIGNCLIHPAGKWLGWLWQPEDDPGPEGIFTLIAKRSLGWLLRVRGVTCLHATVVIVEGRAIALLGESGVGKSTMAAALLAQGYPLLTDDVTALHDDRVVFNVQPGFPMLPLSPSTIEQFFPSVAPFRYVWPASPPTEDEKRYVDLKMNSPNEIGGHGWRFHAEPMPLAAIYLLGEYTEGETNIIVEPVNPVEGLVALASNTYVGYMLDQTGRAREFERLGRVATNIPIRRVRRPWGLEYLTQIAEAIVVDACKLTQHSVVPDDAGSRYDEKNEEF